MEEYLSKSELASPTISNLCRYCKNYSFLVKVDDDVFLQLDKLRRMLSAIKRMPAVPKSVIIGNTASGWKPVRNNASKYFITQSQVSTLMLMLLIYPSEVRINFNARSFSVRR